MSHSSLCSPREDAYMFGTEKNKPYRPEQRVLEGLLWSGRHCFVTVKVQLLGGKTNTEYADILSDQIWLK